MTRRTSLMLSGLCAILLAGCQPAPPPSCALYFLDEADGAAQIQQDEQEGFFGLVQTLDMRLQMGKLDGPPGPRESLLAAYREALAQEVSAFSPPEISKLRKLMAEACQMASALLPAGAVDTVKLVKIKGELYGPSVFYTRERAIFLPANELESTKATLLPILLHELFHLYSRYHPEQRAALYALIGFEPIGKPLYLPSELQERLLLNPDGIDWAYAIELPAEQGRAQRYVPLLLADTTGAQPGQPYFDFMDFQLYPIIASEAGIEVLPKPVYPNEQPAFWAQVGRNTEYIIHPDEILADNFVLLALSEAGYLDLTAAGYTEEGLALLERMRSVLAGPG